MANRALVLLLGGLAFVAIIAVKDSEDSQRVAAADQAGRIVSEQISAHLPDYAGVHSVVTTRTEVMIWVTSHVAVDLAALCPTRQWPGWRNLGNRRIVIEGAGQLVHCSSGGPSA